MYEGRNVINVSGMTGKANTSYVDDDGVGENVSFVKFQCRKSGKYQFTESDFKGKSKNEVIYNDNNYLMFLPKELKSGYEIYDPWNSTYYQFLSRTFASGYGKVWYDVNASKKTYEKCEACNKKFGRVYKRYPEGTAEEKRQYFQIQYGI